MSWQDVLQNYARLKDPARDLPPNVLLRHNDRTLTIYDGYEKAKFHFLIMPRDPFVLQSGKTLPSHFLDQLSSLLKSSDALEVLEALREEAEHVKSMIRQDMQDKDGWEWPVQAGFHAVESMKHVHLHVISQDFISPKLKNKKHYNSFHPTLGFFLHLDEVIEDKRAKAHTLGPRENYELLLKDPLVSHYNKREFKTIPKLKEHLEDEWKRRGQQARKNNNESKKRALSPGPAAGPSEKSAANQATSDDSKRQKV